MSSIAEIVVAGLCLLILVLCAGAVGAFAVDIKWVQPAVAFLAIAVALWLAIEQRFNAEQLRREDQKRLHDSHRAKLTFALSRVSSYANLCADTLRNIVDENRDDLRQTKSLLDFPKIEPMCPDAKAIRDIADSIASCADRLNARALSRLLHWMQIQTSRTEGFLAKGGRTVSHLEIASSLCDAACLGAMVGRVFPYSRFQSEKIDIVLTPIAVEGSLTLLHIERGDPQFEAVFAMIPAHVERINKISN